MVGCGWEGFRSVWEEGMRKGDVRFSRKYVGCVFVVGGGGCGFGLFNSFDF